MPEEKMSPSSPQLAIVEHQGVAVALSAKEVASIYKKSRQSGIPFDTLEEVYRRGYSSWTPDLKETPTQTAFNRVNSFIAEGAAAAMDSDLINEKRGLWDNIHAKRERIKRGSGERMRKPGEKGAPTAAALKASQTEERYLGAEKRSNDPNNPASRFDGDARVYIASTPGQEVNLKHVEGGSKLKTIKRVMKEACSCEDAEAKPESIKSAMAKMNKLKTPEEKAEFLDKYAKSALKKGGFTDGRFEKMTKEEVELEEKWSDAKHKSPSGGLTRAGVMAYRRENPGSKLQTAVTTKPSKLKKGSKAAKRRKSFCARMGGMKKRLTSAKTARDPNSRINKALRKWNC